MPSTQGHPIIVYPLCDLSCGVPNLPEKFQPCILKVEMH